MNPINNPLSKPLGGNPTANRKTTDRDRKVGTNASGVTFRAKESEVIKSLTPEERLIELENTVLFVHESAFIQSERMQALTDGAILAAEQVQNMRLSLMEKEPEVTATTVLLDILIGFALDSTIAGRVLAGITKRYIAPMLRPSVVFSSVSEDAGLKELAKAVVAKGAGTLNDPERYIPFNSRFVDALFEGSSGVEKNWAAFGKAAKRAHDKPVRSAPVLSVEDSPGVVVLAAAQRYASQQRFAIFLQHSVLEAGVRAGLLHRWDIENLLNWEGEATDKEAAAGGMADLRDYYRLLYEAAIWAKLFRYDSDTPRIDVGGVFTPMSLEGAPKAVLSYWLRRFINPQTLRTFGGDPVPFDTKVTNLHNHFKAIGAKWKKRKQDVGEDGMNVVTPPSLKP